jgi:DNA-binding transcriptional LysR family regulator
MDYNDIPLFVRVVETGSFSAAAAALDTQKSTVSRNVARLEEDLGVRLLQRTTRKLVLTDAGKVFYERVRGAISGLEEAAGTAQDLGGEPKGVVRVTAPPDADSEAIGLSRLVARFIEQNPKIHVELSLTSRRVDLVAEGFDIAVRAGKMADSSLVARKVGTSTFALFAAPEYLSRRGTPKALADVSRHACVLFQSHGGRATWKLQGPDGEESVEVSGSLSADDLSFVASCVVAGAGIGLLPMPLAREAVQKGALRMVLKDYRIEGAGVHVVLPSAAFVPARVALLRDFLVTNLTKELAAIQSECSEKEGVSPRGKRSGRAR